MAINQEQLDKFNDPQACLAWLESLPEGHLFDAAGKTSDVYLGCLVSQWGREIFKEFSTSVYFAWAGPSCQDDEVEIRLIEWLRDISHKACEHETYDIEGERRFSKAKAIELVKEAVEYERRIMG